MPVTVEVTRLVEVTPKPSATPENVGGFGSPECDTYSKTVLDIIQRWEDVFEIASATARVNLSDRVSELNDIRQEVRALDEPECAEQLEIQERLINMTGAGIDVFTEFMAENDTAMRFAQADYIMHSDLVFDSIGALSSRSKELPNRIHYYAFGETGFAIRYKDANGNIIVPESTNDRFGFDEMPAVFSEIISPSSSLSEKELWDADFHD